MQVFSAVLNETQAQPTSVCSDGGQAGRIWLQTRENEMGGLNVAFNTIQSALEADQEAINTTANNVANANTPGYTEETVTWQETAPITMDGQQFGTGVEITSVNSQGSPVLDQAIDQQQQSLSAATAREAGLTDIEDIFNQVATDSSGSGSGGIGGALTNFFSALSTLESSPAESASRTGFLSSAQALATSFNSAASQLSAQTNSTEPSGHQQRPAD